MVRASALGWIVCLFVGQAAVAQQVTLLDFTTPGCGPCRRMAPVVTRLESEGVRVQRIDASRSPQIAQRFRVSRYPTFIVLSGQREVKRVVGMVSYQSLRQMLGAAAASPAAAPSPRPGPTGPRTFKEPGDSLIRPITNAAPRIPDIDIPGQPQRPQPPADQGTDHSQLINASVRLKVQDDKGHSFGTGTIVDSRQGEALVLTCAHMFRDDSGRTMDNPQAVTVELYQASATGPKVIERTPVFRILSCNFESDVAFVSIRHKSPVRPARIAARRDALRQGIAVFSVGCDKGADPTVRSSRVKAINRYLGPPNVTASGAPVVGRSGGGLFTAQGEVVGVCNAADYDSDEGIYAALGAIHAELDNLQLTAIYRDSPSVALASASAPVSSVPPAPQEKMAPLGPPSVVRGQDRGEAGTLAGLSVAERAALEEIAQTASDSEVVCVIRPKSPGGRSRVLTLDSVSPEFVRALLAMKRERQPAQ